MLIIKRREKNCSVINNLQSKQKALNLLGLAMKAGKMVTGTEKVLAELKKKKIQVVIIAQDLQANTRKKIERAAHKHQVVIIHPFNSQEMSQAIGRERKVLALTDRGFYQALSKQIDRGV